MRSNQKFTVNGNTYDISNIPLLDNGISLFNAESGVGGYEYMPADGETVIVAAGKLTGDETTFRTFDPTML